MCRLGPLGGGRGRQCDRRQRARTRRLPAPCESCSEARSELWDWLECTFDVRTRTMVAVLRRVAVHGSNRTGPWAR